MEDTTLHRVTGKRAARWFRKLRGNKAGSGKGGSSWVSQDNSTEGHVVDVQASAGNNPVELSLSWR